MEKKERQQGKRVRMLQISTGVSDAPTVRGSKHVNELIKAKNEGYECMILLVIQMKGVVSFTPNSETDPLFAESLKKAQVSGVEITAVDCVVTPDTMTMDKIVRVVL